MLNRVLAFGGQRAVQRGLAARAAQRFGGPFGGLLPIAAYFAWKHRDAIRNAVAEWRAPRRHAQAASTGY